MFFFQIFVIIKEHDIWILVFLAEYIWILRGNIHSPNGISSLWTPKPTFGAEINDIKAKSKSNMEDGEIETEKQKWLQNKI